MRLDQDRARKLAKHLLRDARDGDPVALSRLAGSDPPRLADAQRAVARELGFGSWSAFVDATADPAHERRSETLLVPGPVYLPGRPVRVRMRRREDRVDLDDLGGAVALTGTPDGWLAAARSAVDALDWNLRRNGIVFMQVRAGSPLDWWVQRTAEASLAVFAAVVSLED